MEKWLTLGLGQVMYKINKEILTHTHTHTHIIKTEPHENEDMPKGYRSQLKERPMAEAGTS